MRSRRRPWHYFLLILVLCLVFWITSHWFYSSGSFLIISPGRTGSGGVFGPNDQLALIHVVEEHHDVIPDWFNEMTGSALGRYIIVHIDAHSDSAPPDLVNNFPLFRTPKNDNEIAACMQANDRFIMSAVATGLVQRVIWIYPYWVMKNLYTSKQISLGATNGGRPLVSSLCYCVKESGVKGTKCFYTSINEKEKDEFHKEIPLMKHQCIGNISFQIEEIKDIYALTRLKAEKSWIPPGSPSAPTPLILDIDEDFFGVELPSRHLAPVGLSLAAIEPISVALAGLFCPKNMAAEFNVNAWFQDLLRALSQAQCTTTLAESATPMDRLCTSQTAAYETLFLPYSIFLRMNGTINDEVETEL